MSLDQNDIDRLVTDYRGDFSPDVERGLRQLHSRITPVHQLRPRRRGRGAINRLVGIAAAILLLVAAALFVFTGEGRTYLTNQDQQIAEYVLPDGSRVSLQQGSRLSYEPDSYNVSERRLDFHGQGYFEVTHDSSRPFLVTNGSSQVRVTGTAFNVRVEEELLEVEVSEGSVMVNTSDKSLPVSAMEYATVVSGQPLIHHSAPNLNHHAWRTGLLKFDHTPISEVLTYFTDNWGIICEWQDGKVCNYEVSGTFNSRDVAAVLNDIAKLGGLSVRSTHEDGKHFELSGTCHQ